MSQFQLGPETPSPFSVLSEGHLQKRCKIPHIPDYEKFSFGKIYEERMCELVHKYLELGTDDSLCYVGEEKGNLAPMLQSNFCILKPITTVIPGHIHYEESPNHKMLPVRISNVGSEEFFKNEAKQSPRFDKVMLRDAILYFEDPKLMYKNVMKTVKEDGKMLIIHRPAPMNTLPLSREAKERILDHDHAYIKIIQDLQDLKFDVQWEIECLPIIMPKLKWLAMMKEKFPPQMEIISNYEVRLGMRELSEGVLKYGGDIVEFQDRLLFITVNPTQFSDYPSIQRAGQSCMEPFTGVKDLSLKMEVTPDIKNYVLRKQKLQEKQEQKKKAAMF